jgi:hypothetical protein
VGPIDANFASTESSWSKIDYKSDPHAISLWGGGETRNTQYGSTDCKDRRGDATGAAPGCPFASIDIISFNTMIKRE